MANITGTSPVSRWVQVWTRALETMKITWTLITLTCAGLLLAILVGISHVPKEALMKSAWDIVGNSLLFGMFYFIGAAGIMVIALIPLFLFLRRLKVPRYVENSVHSEMEKLALGTEGGEMRSFLDHIGSRYDASPGEGEQFIDMAISAGVKPKDICSFAEETNRIAMLEYVKGSLPMDGTKALVLLGVSVVLLKLVFLYWGVVIPRLIAVADVATWKQYWPGLVIGLLIFNRLTLHEVIQKFLPEKVSKKKEKAE